MPTTVIPPRVIKAGHLARGVHYDVQELGGRIPPRRAAYVLHTGVRAARGGLLEGVLPYRGYLHLPVAAALQPGLAPEDAFAPHDAAAAVRLEALGVGDEAGAQTPCDAHGELAAHVRGREERRRWRALADNIRQRGREGAGGRAFRAVQYQDMPGSAGCALRCLPSVRRKRAGRPAEGGRELAGGREQLEPRAAVLNEYPYILCSH